MAVMLGGFCLGFNNNFCRGRCKGLVPDLGQEAAGPILVLWGHRFVLYHLK